MLCKCLKGKITLQMLEEELGLHEFKSKKKHKKSLKTVVTPETCKITTVLISLGNNVWIVQPLIAFLISVSQYFLAVGRGNKDIKPIEKNHTHALGGRIQWKIRAINKEPNTATERMFLTAMCKIYWCTIRGMWNWLIFCWILTSLMFYGLKAYIHWTKL